MKKLIYLFLLIGSFGLVNAQDAQQFSGVDCNGNPVDLFADLDAGKAVILHFYMPSCGSCPPPAQKIQAMANRINAQYPGKVKGYAFPFQNSTTCAYSQSWVSSNNLADLYIPMDSGESQLAGYGGFGMPTVVVVGGANHKVLFSTLAFQTSDTTIMRDKILALIGATGLGETTVLNHLEIFPNPSNQGRFSVSFQLKAPADVLIEVTDLSGKTVSVLAKEQVSGTFNKSFDNQNLTPGVYLLRVKAGNESMTQKLNITH